MRSTIASSTTSSGRSIDKMLPLVDVVVSNGGYGGAQQALAHGIPLVVAGRTEDKVEVTARVGWSGAGIDLRTHRPSPDAVRDAVRTVLADRAYSARARRLADAFAVAPGLAGLDAVLRELAPAPAV
ncbi:hypothetical protein G3N18_12630 [Microbacterium sp. 2C]|uniref:glycosyltransferase n=1 Tax=Microbacterium TaxID=33882 RepID=UPI0018C21CD0|nr:MULTISPECIES: nucleotide disphospho-sugar-binding domain-containing protein [Microbacterium]MBG0718892.1 hypothetical protein [Microbacterium paulum]